MLSRRTLLLGGVGAAGAATATVAVVGPRRVGYELGVVASPDHRVPRSDVPVDEFTLTSPHMPEPVAWAIAVPSIPPAGVVLCLHGRNGDHTAAFRKMFLHDVAADLGLALAIVGVDGGPSSYWHPRSDGSDPMSMILEELLPAVDEALGATLPRAALGWSMGGYGALLLASVYPDTFSTVTAASPALWHHPSDASDGAFDNGDDFRDHDVFAMRGALNSSIVRVDCGTDDGFHDAAKAYAKGLPNPNLGTFSGGFHDDAYWRSIAPLQLTTITKAIESTSQ